MQTKIITNFMVNNQHKNLNSNLFLEKQLDQLIKSSKTKTGRDLKGVKLLPESTKERLISNGIDLSQGYPEIPEKEDFPLYLDEVESIRNNDIDYDDRAKFADPKKNTLFGAAKEVKNLTTHIGTEIVGLQLSELNEKQKNELALLVAERVVVFFRDQKLSPQKQLELGHYFGNVEVHAQAPRVPGLPGTTVIWTDYAIRNGYPINFKNNNYGNWDAVRYDLPSTKVWHSDLSHERQTAGYTHLHLDAIPEVGGDTLWASGYAAYDKLSKEFQKFLDGKKGIYLSLHKYIDKTDPFGGPKHIERVHPIIRTHPITGWKALYVNRQMTKKVLGVSPVESDLILNYLFDIYEKNADIQVRFNWNSKPGFGTSAIWDNRVSQHRNVWDHEGNLPRHGTRVTSLAEKPFFESNSKSQRETLGFTLD